MRCFYRFGLLCWLAAALAGVARAETYTLLDGESFTGELVSPDDKGGLIRQADGKYAEIALPDGRTTQRIPWSKFTQPDLKRLFNDKRVAPYVEPWIDIVPTERTREKEFTVKEVTRLAHPPAGSFFGAFASAGIGLTILFFLYLANIYAAYEIALVRAYPWALVCGLAAIGPVLVPVIFLCLPTRIKAAPEDDLVGLDAQAQAAMELAAAQAALAEQHAAEGGAGGLSLAKGGAAARPDLPPTQAFARGQFTFNRRFFETKFANFFGVVRREADKDMLLLFKTARGQFQAERISRIAANELHLQVRKGPATEEVTVPFIEIQEVVLKHKDAPE